SPQRLSRWERGIDRPSKGYLDALCRLYQSRPDLLGLGVDYSSEHSARHGDPGAEPGLGPPERPTARSDPVPSGRGGAERTWEELDDGTQGGDNDMLRRRLIQGVIAAAAGYYSVPFRVALGELRRRVDGALVGEGPGESGVDRWERKAR